MNRAISTEDISMPNKDLELRRGPWTLEEDTRLISYISCNGEGHWNSLAKHAGLKRTGKSCRLRWLNYLKPDIKRGDLTPQEQLLILDLHSKWGNRWSKIAQQLPGRTDNEIKNYWRTRVQKQARQLKIDSNSRKFVEVVRCYLMPRLIEKMDQTSPPLVPRNSTLTMATQSSTVRPSELTNRIHPMPKSTEAMEDLNNATENSKIAPSCYDKPLELPQVLETFDDFVYYNPIPDDCYHVEACRWDMESSNQEDTSALSSPSISLLDCQMDDGVWLGDMTCASSNIDELWQSRKAQ